MHIYTLSLSDMYANTHTRMHTHIHTHTDTHSRLSVICPNNGNRFCISFISFQK